MAFRNKLLLGRAVVGPAGNLKRSLVVPQAPGKAVFSGKTRSETDGRDTSTSQLSALKLGKETRRRFADYMELTKFKLSLLNSIGSYTMFYFHAPLVGVGLANSALFMFATQTIAMSTQCFGQVKEAEFDALMARTWPAETEQSQCDPSLAS